MIIIDNQPVKFNESLNACHLDYLRYKQLVQLGDITNFQVRIGDCPLPENVIANGGFATNLTSWSNNSSWVWDNGKSCNTSSGQQEISQSTTLKGHFYRVEVTVSDLVSTDTTNPSSGKLDVKLGANVIKTINTNGIYVLYGYVTQTSEIFFVKRADTEVCIDNVAAFEVPIDHIVAIYDENDTFITDLKVKDFLSVTTFITDEFTIAQDFLTGFVDWSTLAIAEGCYKICLLDACKNTNFQNYIPNGEFTIASNSVFRKWIPSSAFAFFGQGQLNFQGAAALATDNVSQVGVKSGCSYTFQLDIIAISDAKVWVQYGTQKSSEFTTTGVKSETITADGTTIAIHVEGTDAINSPDVRIDFIKHDINTGCYETDYCSTLFDLKTTHSCTLRANGSNDPAESDDFGFLFKGSNFNPTIRLKSKLVGAQYPMEIDKEEDSFGYDKLILYQRVKTKKWRIERQPEYVHDFLSLIYGLDHFFIGETEYSVMSEELPLAYDAEDNVTRSIIELREKQQLIRNNLCIKEGNSGGIPLGDSFIEEPGNPPGGPAIVIEPETDVKLSIPG